MSVNKIYLQVIPGPVSKEEQLLWERKKCASWGMTSYDLDPVSGRILFPAGGSLFFCSDPASGHTGPLFPYEIQVSKNNIFRELFFCK